MLILNNTSLIIASGPTKKISSNVIKLANVDIRSTGCTGFLIRFLTCTKLAQFQLELNQCIINCAIQLSLNMCNSIITIMCYFQYYY